MDVDVTALVGRRAEDRWNRVCVGDLIERNVWGRPDQDAFVALPGACTEPRFARLDYRQANGVCDQLAQGFLARGLQRGDRVLLVCENSVEAVLIKLATAKAGLVAVPLNPSLAPDVLAHLAALTEPGLAVVDDELVAAAGPVLADAGVPIGITLTVTGGPVAEGSVGFGAFADAQPAVEPDGPVHGDDIYELLFTSGTTALPKGVMLSHTNATLSAHGFALSLSRGVPAEEDVRLLSFLPVVYHVGDQIFTLSVLACGGTVIVGRRPEPGAIAAAIAQGRPTVLWGGSPQLVKGVTGALEAGDVDAASLRVVVYGWGALEPAVLASLTARCPEVRTMGIFGQTEAIACHRFWPDRHVETYRASAPAVNYVGLPHPLLASKVVDLDGADLVGAPGVPGEAVYRSPSVTHGYYRDPDATREAFRDGWFHSGQLRLRRRRPARDGRPLQGHHQDRRRERVEPAGGVGARPAPGGRPGGGDRPAPRRLGRGRDRGGRPRAGSGGRRRRGHRVRPRAPRRVRDAQAARGHRRPAGDRRRQGAQVQAPDRARGPLRGAHVSEIRGYGRELHSRTP